MDFFSGCWNKDVVGLSLPIRRSVLDVCSLMMLLIWFVAIAGMWVSLLKTRKPSSRAKPVSYLYDSLSLQRLRIGLFFAFPPTIVWGICTFVLLQTAPTVQFNVGNETAMD